MGLNFTQMALAFKTFLITQPNFKIPLGKKPEFHRNLLACDIPGFLWHETIEQELPVQ